MQNQWSRHTHLIQPLARVQIQAQVQVQALALVVVVITVAGLALV